MSIVFWSHTADPMFLGHLGIFCTLRNLLPIHMVMDDAPVRAYYMFPHPWKPCLWTIEWQHFLHITEFTTHHIDFKFKNRIRYKPDQDCID